MTVREKYGSRLDAIPALAAFCERAGASVRAADPDTLWDVEPAFRDLLSTDVVDAFLAHELGNIAARPQHFLLGSSDFHAPLVETPAYTLVIKLLTPDVLASASVVSLTEHALMAVWCGSVEVEAFEIEQPFRIDVFDRSRPLRLRSKTTLGPGEVRRFESPSQTFRLRTERPAVLVQIISAIVAPLRWVFDPDSLLPVRAAAARLSSSRLQFTCQTLAALGSPTSIPALKRLTHHPEHYVRWAAVQSLCALSGDEGLECVRRALDDDHPHIRRAAEKTLGDHHSV